MTKKKKNKHSKWLSLDNFKSGGNEQENDAEHPCWQCSCLKFDGNDNYIYCYHNMVMFLPGEVSPDMSKCNLKNYDRPKIAEKCSYLLRLLCVCPKIAINSLPSELIGCIGTLQNYKLVYIDKAKVRKFKRANSPYFNYCKEKVVCLGKQSD